MWMTWFRLPIPSSMICAMVGDPPRAHRTQVMVRTTTEDDEQRDDTHEERGSKGDPQHGAATFCAAVSAEDAHPDRTAPQCQSRERGAEHRLGRLESRARTHVAALRASGPSLELHSSLA